MRNKLLKSTFEYHKGDKKRSPFEIFLDYTNEKEVTSSRVAEIMLASKKIEAINLLDIGSGNGEFTLLVLKRIKDDFSAIHIDFLEPSQDLIDSLKCNIEELDIVFTKSIFHTKWETFLPTKKYDYLLVSHLYHFVKKDMYAEFLKMLNSLKKGGRLIFILREEDDPYEFKHKFKPIIHNLSGYYPRLISDAYEVFEKIRKRTKQ